MTRAAVLAGILCLTESSSAAPRIRFGVKIPMRDGVRLDATLYLPVASARRTRHPVVLTITPYVSDRFHGIGNHFARHGFVFAAVDSRGRGNSGGGFAPFERDGQDGRDVVQWLARQPFCDGRVVMWGGSYSGFSQWATLARRPPALRAIAPAAPVYPGVGFPHWNTLNIPYVMQWLALVAGRTRNVNAYLDSAFWFARFHELHRSGRPFKDLPQLVGLSAPSFRRWLQHPHPDAYWDRLVPSAEAYRRSDVPVLTITGLYDGNQADALGFHNNHLQARPNAQHYLVIGPWDHAGTRAPRPSFGGLSFAETAMVDLKRLHVEWYDWALRRRARPPAFLKKRVVYFVAGAGEWRYADSLAKIPTRPRRLYLHSDGRASDVFHSGALRRTAPDSHGSPVKPDTYVSDPRDLSYLQHDRADYWIRDTWVDQRHALGLKGNGLVYHSEPLKRDTELLGRATLKVWVAIDVRDTDFLAALFEVRPDGGVIFLGEAGLRARHRRSRRKPWLVEQGKALPYSFVFPFMARRMVRGSRLRLTFGPPNTVRLAKNYQGGGAVAFESVKDAKVGRIKLFHDAKHPSFVELPLSTTLGLMEGYR